MTWSISVSGSKQQCVEALTAARHPLDVPDAEPEPSVLADLAQFDDARHAILDEIESYPETATSITVSASGHASTTTSRNLNISISGAV